MNKVGKIVQVAEDVKTAKLFRITALRSLHVGFMPFLETTKQRCDYDNDLTNSTRKHVFSFIERTREARKSFGSARHLPPSSPRNKDRIRWQVKQAQDSQHSSPNIST